MNQDEDKDWKWAVIGLLFLFFSLWLLMHFAVGHELCMTDMECELRCGAE